MSPKRSALLGLLAVSCQGSEFESPPPPPTPSTSCGVGPAGPADGEGPAAILEMEGFGAVPDNLGIDTDSITTDWAEVAGRTVYAVTFTVTTFEDFHGSDWEHTVVLLSPDPDELVSDRAAVAEMGTLNEIGEGDSDPTWGTSWPDWFAGSEGAEEIATTAALVALDLGLPVILTNIVPGPLELDEELHATVSSSLAETTPLLIPNYGHGSRSVIGRMARSPRRARPGERRANLGVGPRGGGDLPRQGVEHVDLSRLQAA